MQKTVVVEVVTHRGSALRQVRPVALPLQGARREERIQTGDQVEIQEHRPISRDKRWLVTRLVKKFVEE
jgi:small subunit ribosomal protein S17